MSALPQKEGWTLVHTSFILNRLMVTALEYKNYAAQAGDWVYTHKTTLIYSL